jgi:phosphoglycolate phosphatase
VVTRNASAVARQALRLLGRSTLPVVGRHDTGRWKPHPEALLTLLDRLGVSPPDTVVVGDSWHDVAMARRAGARAVVVRHERGPAPDGADLYVDSLLQLSELLTRPVLLPPTR